MQVEPLFRIDATPPELWQLRQALNHYIGRMKMLDHQDAATKKKIDLSTELFNRIDQVLIKQG